MYICIRGWTKSIMVTTNIAIVSVYFFLLLLAIARRQYQQAQRLTLVTMYVWNILHVFIKPSTDSTGGAGEVDGDLFGVTWTTVLIVIYTLATIHIHDTPRVFPTLLSGLYIAWGMAWVTWWPLDLLQRQLWYPIGLLLAVYLFCAYSRPARRGASELKKPLLVEAPRGGPLEWEEANREVPVQVRESW